MIVFQCPHCQTSLKASEDKIGALSKCRRCGFPLRVPDPDAPHERTDYVDGEDGSLEEEDYASSEEEYDEQTGTRRLSEKIGAAILWMFWAVDLIFDFRFRRYLTPYLLRFFWAALLLLCVVGLTTSVVTDGLTALVGNPLQERMTSDRTEWPERDRFSQPPPTQKQSTKAEMRQALKDIGEWIVRFVLRLGLAAMFLAWMRMMSELMLVFFDISNSLKEARALYQRRRKMSAET